MYRYIGTPTVFIRPLPVTCPRALLATLSGAEKRASKSHQELFEICSLEQAHFLSQQDTEALTEDSDTKVGPFIFSSTSGYISGMYEAQIRPASLIATL